MLGAQPFNRVCPVELVKCEPHPCDELPRDMRRDRNLAGTSCRLDEYKPAPYFNGGRIFRKVTPTVHGPTPLRSKTTERFGIAPLTCVKGKINFPVVAPFLPTARIARRTEAPTMGQVPDFANDPLPTPANDDDWRDAA